ncbi:MAG: carboxypeptidase regulatory-like domain-containing protein [Prevotella sp.]|nr:carboxypeptidase regulatory-like domain-containing protein [Prevotella sp.]
MKKIRFLLVTLVALLAGVSSVAGKTVYVDPVGTSTWMADNPAISLYVFGDGDGWATSETLSDGVIKFTFDDKYTSMIIVRGPQANANSFDNKYNQTADITSIEVGKLYKANGYNGDQLIFTVEDYTEPAPAPGYTVDFNTAIAVPSNNHSDPMFKVSTGWTRIADRKDGDGYYGTAGYYMRYTYSSTAGVSGTGTLLANAQQAPQSTYDGTIETVYDYIVTPKVSGTVTLQVKGSTSASSSLPSFISFYAVDDNATTIGSELVATYSSELNTNDFVTATLTLSEPTRIAIRGQWVYMDNFTATSAEIPEVKALTVTSVMNSDGQSGYTGTNPSFEQQSDGKLLVKLKVAIQNTGNVNIVAGTTENYTLTLASASSASATKTYYEDAAITLTEDLAIGASTTIDVEVAVNYTDTYGSYRYWFVREDVSGTTSSSYRYATSVAYEPKFIFREAGSASTSSISTAESWGTITTETTKSFEIANTGTAPLTIKSVTLPTGFTSDNAPTAEFTLAKNETQALNITQDATATGTFSGTLTIVYLDKNAAEQTYSLAFSATVIGANTWTADFNGDGTSSSITYPASSIAEGGITSDYAYSSGKYNVWLQGRTQNDYATGNNMFITPKLHATAGDKLAYDVKGVYDSNNVYYAKVYVSTDRKNWGDPVAYYTTNTVAGAEAIGNVNWNTKTITFDTDGDYYVAFSLYGAMKIDNLVGLEKVDVAHDIYIKSVSWPDASIKSGATQSKPSVDIIPLTNEDAANYTVKYIYGENVVDIASKALTASASSTTNFAASFAPSVTTTTTFPGTKVVFEFTDGTKFETETFDLTVTNEPIFHFLNSIPSSKWYEPTDRSEAIAFGKTNTADTQSFYLYNWGSAPLTVNSISLPEGFSTTTTFPVTIAAMDENNLSASAQALDITFSATAAGTYSGDMLITHSGDQTFTLGISGTRLDPTKFYANFNDQQWPAGSVYQDNVSISYINTGDYGLLSSSSTKNVFITPKLTAVAGDVLQFDASTRNNYYNGTVKVYVTTDRENLGDAVKEIELSKTDNVSKSTYEYQFAVAGDFYVAFALEEARVDEIYGLKLAEVEHDLKISSSNIPTEGMQNNSYTASVNVLNFGLNDDAVTVTAYVDGEAMATSAAVNIPMNHKLTDAGTQASVSFVCPKTGEHAVYLEVKAGAYSVATAPVNVTFAEEVAKNDAVAEADGVSTNVPLNLSYYNSESVSLYTPAVLESAYGLSNGAKIKSITYKGYKNTDEHTSTLNVWYEWVDAAAQSQPATGLYNTEGMTQIITDQTQTWEKKGSSTSLEDFITINFSDPLVYQGKALRIVVRSKSNAWKSVNFEKGTSATSGLAWYHYNDTESTFNTNSWTSSVLPVLHMALESSSATLAGTVKTSAGAGIEGASVTLKADSGVEYSGTTDATGAYSINVIQGGLSFTATVEATGYLKKQFALPNMGGANATQNVVLFKQFGLVGTMPGFNGWDDDMVMTQSTENPNIFTLEMNNVDVTAGDYEFKLRADGAWSLSDGYYKPNFDNGNDPENGYTVSGGNYKWNFATTGTYNFLFTLDLSTSTLTFERPFTLSENSTGVADLNWVDVTVEREFKAGWNALVLPFDLTAAEVANAFGDACEMAVYDGDSNDSGNVTVKFKKITGADKFISAGYPYMLWLENPVSGLKFTKNISSTLITAPGTTFDFVGVYTTTTTADGDYFVKGGEFKKCDTSNKVLPFRAYLKLKCGATVRSFYFLVGDEDVTTEIDGLEIDTPVKVEGAYNLNGQKVENLKKGGLYIINGKKVVIK